MAKLRILAAVLLVGTMAAASSAALADDFSGEDGDDGTPIQAPENGTSTILHHASMGTPEIDLTVDGGDGGDSAGWGGPGGNGGKGGLVTASGTDIANGITIVARGGNGGSGDGFDDGNGGDGGDVDLTLSGHIGMNGPNTSVRIDVAGGTGTVSGQGGTVVVHVADGTEVASRIAVQNASQATLDFSGITVKDKAEFKALNEYLSNPANAAIGGATINGHNYMWNGFTDIQSVLAAIRKLVGSTGIPAHPDYLDCRPGGVKAIDKGDVVTFNAKGDGGWFHVGELVDGGFFSSNVSGWTVTLDGKGRKQVAQVWNGAGELVSTCKL
ncbi:MAG: hypothetical protein ABL879_09115 [Devosia sp.]